MIIYIHHVPDGSHRHIRGDYYQTRTRRANYNFVVSLSPAPIKFTGPRENNALTQFPATPIASVRAERLDAKRFHAPLAFARTRVSYIPAHICAHYNNILLNYYINVFIFIEIFDRIFRFAVFKFRIKYNYNFSRRPVPLRLVVNRCIILFTKQNVYLPTHKISRALKLLYFRFIRFRTGQHATVGRYEYL